MAAPPVQLIRDSDGFYKAYLYQLSCRGSLRGSGGSFDLVTCHPHSARYEPRGPDEVYHIWGYEKSRPEVLCELAAAISEAPASREDKHIVLVDSPLHTETWPVQVVNFVPRTVKFGYAMELLRVQASLSETEPALIQLEEVLGPLNIQRVEELCRILAETAQSTAPDRSALATQIEEWLADPELKVVHASAFDVEEYQVQNSDPRHADELGRVRDLMDANPFLLLNVVGVSGTGKSTFARSLGPRHMPRIVLRPSDVLRKFVGDSEKTLMNLADFVIRLGVSASVICEDADVWLGSLQKTFKDFCLKLDDYANQEKNIHVVVSLICRQLLPCVSQNRVVTTFTRLHFRTFMSKSER